MLKSVLTLELSKIMDDSHLVTTTILTGIVVFTTAFTVFATQLGLGMQPTFSATPPVIPINLVPVFTLPFETPIKVRINLMSTIIDTWFRTGLAINNISGVSITWL